MRATMLATRDDEAQLAAGAAQGDARAFDQLVLMHEARVRSFLSRVVGHADAEDVAQEAFVKAWLALPRRRSEARFASWLLAIAWNVALDHLKQTRRSRTRDAAWHALGGVEHRPDGTARIELERALARLSVHERAVLVLTEGHGWSQSEAAGILGMPLGTLKSAALRAKTKVLAAIDGGRA